MLRFTMPEPFLPLPKILEALQVQFENFLQSEALCELFALLGTNCTSLSRDWNGRAAENGAVRETMELSRHQILEERRETLYPLFQELGFIEINSPVRKEHSHILVLGGSLEACFDRTRCAAKWAGAETRYIDALSCYRPIHPQERVNSAFHFDCETEFGAIAKSLAAVFRPDGNDVKEEFSGDRNLNRISCIKTLSRGNPTIRVFAAPSAQPDLRRADTGDSLLFYLDHTPLSSDNSLLAVTNNRYCNRQFLQLTYQLLQTGHPVYFDIIGCIPDERLTSPERYDPFQYLQDLIGVLDWIDRFQSLSNSIRE